MAGGLFGGGNGTSTSPYLIEDIQDLDAVRDDLTAHYKLSTNIDALGYDPNGDSSGWIPIGNSTTPFSGLIDGDFLSIFNLSINRDSDYQGLFGICDGAEIKNLKLKDLSITASNGNFIGGACGKIRSTKMSACVVDNPTLSCNNNVGGLCGHVESNSIIDQSMSIGGTITGGHNVGGLIGNSIGSTVKNSHATSSTSATETKAPTTAPTLGTVNFALPSGTYYSVFTWVDSNGETAKSPESNHTLTDGYDLSVNVPDFPSGVDYANIYISNTSGTETLQGKIYAQATPQPYIQSTPLDTTTESPPETATASTPTTANPTTAPTMGEVLNNNLLAGTHYVVYTWIDDVGETLQSPEVNISVPSGSKLNITMPSFPSAVDKVNVYISTSTGTETLQGETDVTRFVQSTRLSTGSALPTTSTALASQGGLIGNVDTVTIEDCFSANTFNGDATNKGGLIGTATSGTVIDAFYDTTVSTLTVSAGGVAKTTTELQTATTFANWDALIWYIVDGQYPTFPYAMLLYRYLISHDSKYKTYDFINSAWVTVSSSDPTESEFKQRGIYDYKMKDIPSTAWDELKNINPLVKVLSFKESLSALLPTIRVTRDELYDFYDENGKEVEIMLYMTDPSTATLSVSALADYKPIDELGTQFKIVVYDEGDSDPTLSQLLDTHNVSSRLMRKKNRGV